LLNKQEIAKNFIADGYFPYKGMPIRRLHLKKLKKQRFKKRLEDVD